MTLTDFANELAGWIQFDELLYIAIAILLLTAVMFLYLIWRALKTLIGYQEDEWDRRYGDHDQEDQWDDSQSGEDVGP